MLNFWIVKLGLCLKKGGESESKATWKEIVNKLLFQVFYKDIGEGPRSWDQSNHIKMYLCLKDLQTWGKMFFDLQDPQLYDAKYQEENSKPEYLYIGEWVIF